jgi:curved DNA-binding protein CbpA
MPRRTLPGRDAELWTLPDAGEAQLRKAARRASHLPKNAAALCEAPPAPSPPAPAPASPPPPALPLEPLGGGVEVESVEVCAPEARPGAPETSGAIALDIVPEVVADPVQPLEDNRLMHVASAGIEPPPVVVLAPAVCGDAEVRRVLAAASHYDVFGLDPTALPADVDKAYRKLAVKVHPDKNGDANADAAFRRLEEARQALADPVLREGQSALYDAAHAAAIAMAAAAMGAPTDDDAETEPDDDDDGDAEVPIEAEASTQLEDEPEVIDADEEDEEGEEDGHGGEEARGSQEKEAQGGEEAPQGKQEEKVQGGEEAPRGKQQEKVQGGEAQGEEEAQGKEEEPVVVLLHAVAVAPAGAAGSAAAPPQMILYAVSPYHGKRPIMHVLDAAQDPDALSSKKVKRCVFVAHAPATLLGVELKGPNAAVCALRAAIDPSKKALGNNGINKNVALCASASTPRGRPSCSRASSRPSRCTRTSRARGERAQRRRGARREHACPHCCHARHAAAVL